MPLKSRFKITLSYLISQSRHLQSSFNMLLFFGLKRHLYFKGCVHYNFKGRIVTAFLGHYVLCSYSCPYGTIYLALKQQFLIWMPALQDMYSTETE